MPSLPERAGDAADAPVPGRFRPRLTLQTLTRGDGLLGMRAIEGFGPRGAQLSVARADWTYATDAGLSWDTPAPERMLNTRPKPTELLRGAWNQRVLMQRDLTGEADARDALWGSGLRPLPVQALQWRSRDAAADHPGGLWTLREEVQFGDFWAEQVPRLQAQGWSIVVQPGFAHQSVEVDRWRIVIDPLTGDERGRELAEPLGARAQLAALRQPPREGSWMLSLGVDVEGQTLDLSPLLADLLRRDARWLDRSEIAAIPDEALIVLRAPGGRRIDAPAAPLKAIVGAMVDLLTDPRRADGPLQLSTWEA
ncbi:MAG TPA: ATP-dependent helicase, partial [Albitalea sp.]|nr:ATP-dependent helicase [Albitalea sp.]